MIDDSKLVSISIIITLALIVTSLIGMGHLSVTSSDCTPGMEDLDLDISRNHTVVDAPVTLRASHGTCEYNWAIEQAPGNGDTKLHTTSDSVTSMKPQYPGEYIVSVSSGDESKRAAITVDNSSELIKRYAPILHLDSSAPYKPTRVEALVHNSQLIRNDESGNAIVEDENPSVIDLRDKNDSYYLDLKRHRSRWRSYQDDWSPTIYANVVNNTSIIGKEYTAIVYWHIYVHDPKHGFASFGDHQSDVEAAAVLLDKDGGDDLVAVFAHGGVTYQPLIQTERTGTHPHLFIEHRAQATYLRDTSRFNGDGIQVHSHWMNNNAECTDTEQTLSFFHSDWTYSDETWGIDDTDADVEYSLIELTGNESWSTYRGGLSDSPGSITPPHQREYFEDPGGFIQRDGCGVHEEIHGSVSVDEVEKRNGVYILDAVAGNSAGKPHDFWITAEAQNGSILEEKTILIGTKNPGFFSNDTTKTEHVSIELPLGDLDEVEVGLWLHESSVRREHDLVDSEIVELPK